MQRALYVLLGVLLVPTIGLVGDIVTDGKFKSTMSTGAPLEVVSPNMVANLNADMVDGVEGTNLYTKAEVDALVAAAADADSRRAYYITPTQYNGADADSSCEVGFHMASIYEILDTSSLRYDTGRGVTWDDSGMGPPDGWPGWIRTGTDSNGTSTTVGKDNCYAWSSSDASHRGTRVWIATAIDAEWNGPSTRISPWIASWTYCNQTQGVWCIED